MATQNGGPPDRRRLEAAIRGPDEIGPRRPRSAEDLLGVRPWTSGAELAIDGRADSKAPDVGEIGQITSEHTGQHVDKWVAIGSISGLARRRAGRCHDPDPADARARAAGSRN